MIRGMTDASATRKPVRSCTRSCGSATARLSTPIFHVPTACPKLAEAKPRKSPDLVGRSLRTGHDLDLAHTVKGRLISKFTRDFDGSHDSRKILIRAQIVALDYGGILKVFARQTDGASAGWLH
jgi:hypothetical protein